MSNNQESKYLTVKTNAYIQKLKDKYEYIVVIATIM